MPFIFMRTREGIKKSETPFPVEISEVHMGSQLVAYAQNVSANMLQKVLISLADAKQIEDDPDWKGPRQ